MAGVSVNRIYTGLLAVIAILGFYAPTASAELFSADGPFTPSRGTSIGTVDILDSMHYEFDIEIHSFPTSGPWDNILSMAGKLPIVHLTASYNFIVTFQGTNGKLLQTVGDGMLKEGETYHFEFDLDQDWLYATMNGDVVIDERCGAHAVAEDQVIYISNPSGGWGEADVSVSNILIYEQGTITLAPSAHYVAIGNTRHIGKMDGRVESYCQNDNNNQALYSSKKHDYNIAVSCCSQDGSKGYRPDCDSHPATYQEALDLCTSEGYRLCTLQEMLSRKTAGKGCWYDAAYNWVSDECQSTVSVNAAAAVYGDASTMEETNGTDSSHHGTVIGVVIGLVAFAAVWVFLMLLAKKRMKGMAEERETSTSSNAVADHVIPECTLSEVVEEVVTGIPAVITTAGGDAKHGRDRSRTL